MKIQSQLEVGRSLCHNARGHKRVKGYRRISDNPSTMRGKVLSFMTRIVLGKYALTILIFSHFSLLLISLFFEYFFFNLFLFEIHKYQGRLVDINSRENVFIVSFIVPKHVLFSHYVLRKKNCSNTSQHQTSAASGNLLRCNTVFW